MLHISNCKRLSLDVLSALSSQGSEESFSQSGLVANEASLVSVPFNFFKDAKFDIDSRDRSDSVEKQKSTVKDYSALPTFSS